MDSSHTISQQAAGQKRIVLVDDDLTLSEMYSERLRAAGFNVTVVHDGEAALAEAKKKPDLMLLDIMMPKINGLDVLKEIKADPELKDMPVILLTALIQELDKAKGIAGGAVDYYVKSEVMPGDLIEHITKVIGVHGVPAGATLPNPPSTPTPPTPATPAHPGS